MTRLRTMRLDDDFWRYTTVIDAPGTIVAARDRQDHTAVLRDFVRYLLTHGEQVAVRYW